MTRRRTSLESAVVVVTALVTTGIGLSPAVGQPAEPTTDRPQLPEDVAAQIAELQEQIETSMERDEVALAISSAEAILVLRRTRQSTWTDAEGNAAEWWEVGDARRAVDDLRHVATLSAAERAELAEARAAKPTFAEHLDQGRHGEAHDVAELRLHVLRRLLGDDHTDTLSSIDDMGSALRAQGKMEEAERYFRAALDGRHRVLGGDHPDTLMSINNVGAVLYRQGKPADADPYLRAALAGRRRVLGDDHPDTLGSIEWMGGLFYAQGKPSEAEPYFGLALEVRRHVLGDDHPDTLNSIGNMGALLWAQGKLNAAEPYLREELDARRRLFGDDHPDTLTSINNVGYLLQAQGKLVEAEPYYREALEGRRRVLGEDHRDTLTSLNNMGGLLRARGELAAAEPSYRGALEGFRRVLGDDHPDTLSSINNMGALLWAQGKLTAAEPHYREALEGFRRVLGDDHPDTLTSIDNMGTLLWAQGKLSEAESHYREALEGRRHSLGNDHPDTLRSINNMGGVLHSQGKPAEAEPYYREALEGRRRVLGDDHPDTLTSMNNMGFLLDTQGTLTAAETYYREALDGRRRGLADDHPDTLTSIHNIGYLLRARGRLAEAEPYCREALAGRQRVLGDDHPDTLVSMINMGDLLKADERLAEAELYHSKAMEGCRRVLGDDHPNTLVAVFNMGHLLKAEGKSAEAEPYLREALDGRRRVLGDDHPRTLASLKSMGDLLSGGGRLAEAEPYYREALSLAERLRTSVSGAERDRASYAGMLELTEIASGYATLLVRRGREGEALTVAERGRSRALLDLLERAGLDLADQARRQAGPDAKVAAALEVGPRLAEDDGSRVAALQAEARVDSLRAERDVYARQEDLSEQVNRARLASLDAQIARELERVAVARREAFEAGRRVLTELRGLVPDARPLSAEAIVRGLDGGELILAYVWNDAGVLLMTAERGGGTEAMVLSGDVAELSRAVLALCEALSAQPADASTPIDAGEVLARLIPPTVRSRVARADRVVILPDGPLHGLPFGVLLESAPDLGGTQVVYAASATMYLNRKAVGRKLTARARPTALVLGDPVFEQATPGESASRVRGAEASALDQVRLYGGRLDPLPGSAREAERVAALVEDAGGTARLLLGADATVGNLREDVTGRRFVHLATHGLSGSVARPYDASLALTQPAEVMLDDIGFLRLDDLVRDWRGTLEECDLVVLSACDTQRGVRQGDSVMALPWGFFYAGAPTVIASLWKVDDTATALLMGRLYENLLGQHGQSREVSDRTYPPGAPMSKVDALREAKRWLRTLSRADAKKADAELPSVRGIDQRPRTAPVEEARPFAHPYYWAAFVLIRAPSSRGHTGPLRTAVAVSRYARPTPSVT